MKRKCDKCDNPAKVHSIEIIKGAKVEVHLCDEHAAEAGLDSPEAAVQHTPVDELISNFVKLQSGEKKDRHVCANCGMSWATFQESRLLGCPECYDHFDAQLTPLIERAHEGGSHHMGKAPHHAGGDEQRQRQLLRMRKRMSEAVDGEDYELAAHLRDEITKLEEGA